MKSFPFDYELLDSGNQRRIERFGSYIINRSCPQAIWQLKGLDIKEDIFYDREAKAWKSPKKLPESWQIQVGENKAELRLSPNGQVGIFPEQLDNWIWIEKKILENAHRPLKILNTFSYTGMATLFASHKNTEVCHVDGAKSAINWAKQNAEISGKSQNTIRYICDDVQKFIEREIRRGNKYDGIILDPPAFGRGAKKDWKIERDLEGLMELVSQILTDNALFAILTCHAPEHFHEADLAYILEDLPQFKNLKAEELYLEIPSQEGTALDLSFGARIGR